LSEVSEIRPSSGFTSSLRLEEELLEDEAGLSEESVEEE
jgi:hypothetical protein